jgi:hypothetical protein
LHEGAALPKQPYYNYMLSWCTAIRDMNPTIDFCRTFEGCLLRRLSFFRSERDCYLKFEGKIVSMICDIDPKYKKNIFYGKNGRKYMYTKLTKAVLFNEKLSKQLKDWGYKPNCYDRCTFNKMIDGNQITIQFHLDDLKISHMKQSVVDSVLTDLNNEFGTTKKPLAATTGHIHDYLGIIIDYSKIIII